jgi:hypothetical protein
MSRTNNKMKQDFECKFCSKAFHKETTLTTHMCVKKRRHMDINSAGSRFGLRAFQRFYDLTQNSKKQKTAQDFIDSPYYIDFVKFGNHIHTLKPVYPEQFIDFVIRNSVKLNDWCKDFVYDAYIEDLTKKEPAQNATERSIENMIEWATKNNVEFTEFFSRITANEAAYMLRTGKISPWVLYLSNSGDSLMSQFNDDHSKIMGRIIDPGAWAKKFKHSPDDVEYIRTLLDQVGL